MNISNSISQDQYRGNRTATFLGQNPKFTPALPQVAGVAPTPVPPGRAIAGRGRGFVPPPYNLGIGRGNTALGRGRVQLYQPYPPQNVPFPPTQYPIGGRGQHPPTPSTPSFYPNQPTYPHITAYPPPQPPSPRYLIPGQPTAGPTPQTLPYPPPPPPTAPPPPQPFYGTSQQFNAAPQQYNQPRPTTSIPQMPFEKLYPMHGKKASDFPHNAPIPIPPPPNRTGAAIASPPFTPPILAAKGLVPLAPSSSSQTEPIYTNVQMLGHREDIRVIIDDYVSPVWSITAVG